MRRVSLFFLALSFLLFSGQTTEQFPAYVGGLSLATTPLTGGEQLYVLQGGISRRTPVSTLLSAGVLQFQQRGTGSVQRPLQTKIQDSVWIAATDFGADPTGNTDSTAAIQAALNLAALSTTTGNAYVYLSPGGAGYVVSSTLTIGNNANASGIYLVGGGNLAAGGTIFWNGPTGSTTPVIKVNGPISGWGIENLTINANLTAGYGVQVVAAQLGDMHDLIINNATNQGIITQTLTSASAGSVQTQSNHFYNINIFAPNVSNAGCVKLDGNGVNTVSNTNFNTLGTIGCILPTANTAFTGFTFRDADTNKCDVCYVFGGGTGTQPIVFDYTGTSGGAWPSNHTLDVYDPDGSFSTGAKYTNIGSPTSGARPNHFIGIADGNGASYPKLTNTSYKAEFVNPGFAIGGQSASIAAANLNPIPLYLTGQYRVSWYVETATAGTGGTVSLTLTWTDDAQLETFTSTTLALNAKGYIQGQNIMRALTATNIQYSTTVAGATGSPQYAVFLKLEKMD